MCAFPPVLTESIGLSLNHLGLHRRENGLALDQGQPHGLRRHRTCRSAAGHQLARLHVPVRRRQLQPNPPLHPIPPVDNDQKPIAPQL